MTQPTTKPIAAPKVKINPIDVPIQTYLGPLGFTGHTAYIGLFRIGDLKKGETVLVSSAAGSVGSIVCQIAKIKGCRVIASTGSDEKVNWLKNELGVDDAFNYKKIDNLVLHLKSLAPEGYDLYFDNVAETKPMLHLWSLAIEEQFYIIWPVVLWLAWHKRLNLLTISLVVALISFYLNLIIKY